MATIRWQDVYKLDTTGMSPEYQAAMVKALERAEQSETGQELFKELRASSPGEQVTIKMAGKKYDAWFPQDAEPDIVAGKPDMGKRSRGGIYDSDDNTIYMNPKLLTTRYAAEDGGIAGMIVHESDHAARRDYVEKKIDGARTMAEEYVARDSVEMSAQLRENKLRKEVGLPQYEYVEQKDRGTRMAILRGMPEMYEGKIADAIADAFIGSGALQTWRGPDLAERMGRISGMSPEQIQAELNKPSSAAQAEMAKKDPEVVPPDTKHLHKKSVELGG